MPHLDNQLKEISRNSPKIKEQFSEIPSYFLELNTLSQPPILTTLITFRPIS